MCGESRGKGVNALPIWTNAFDAVRARPAGKASPDPNWGGEVKGGEVDMLMCWSDCWMEMGEMETDALRGGTCTAIRSRRSSLSVLCLCSHVGCTHCCLLDTN